MERRGALRGGFVDSRKSRLEAMREYRALAKSIAEGEEEAKSVAAELADVAQEITATTAEISKLAAAQEHAK